jgi:preprotein translocase subunit SecD
LGPSELRLSAANVGSVVAQHNHIGIWIVTIHLSPAGAATWDQVAQENFHQLLAIDMGGKVVSAPIIEPVQSSYTSFNGKMEVSGALTAADARAVAAAVRG